jgi:hypothetical protein
MIQELLEATKAEIFGGLLDLMARTLDVLPMVEVNAVDLPRMADFAILGEAVYGALGRPPGSFLRGAAQELSVSDARMDGRMGGKHRGRAA